MYACQPPVGLLIGSGIQDFRPTVLHLESLGVEPSLMGKLFRRHPQLLKNRRSLELKLDFLLSLGLEPKDLGKVRVFVHYVWAA